MVKSIEIHEKNFIQKCRTEQIRPGLVKFQSGFSLNINTLIYFQIVIEIKINVRNNNLPQKKPIFFKH